MFADIAVAILRTEAGRNPYDEDLHDLVGEVSTRSEEFRTRWGAHNVRRHGRGTKRFRHKVSGGHPGLREPGAGRHPGPTLTVYATEPGSPSEQALHLLASWAATDTSATTNERQSPSSPSSA
ncbi:MmyB family transcriptional regulator [Streptomyces massasporeus]|uniref:MmyB family transcriptional regulator n=1 Tax=Streptomyces massasporeus TaxID=67324 RepID=UPI0036FEFDF8